MKIITEDLLTSSGLLKEKKNLMISFATNRLKQAAHAFIVERGLAFEIKLKLFYVIY